jgi:hypothetical protein
MKHGFFSVLFLLVLVIDFWTLGSTGCQPVVRGSLQRTLCYHEVKTLDPPGKLPGGTG